MLRHVRICCIQKIASHHGYSNSNIIRTSRNYSICMYWWSSQTCITYHHPAPPHLTYCWATFTLKRLTRSAQQILATQQQQHVQQLVCCCCCCCCCCCWCCVTLLFGWLVWIDRTSMCKGLIYLSILVGVSYWLVTSDIYQPFSLPVAVS